MDSLGHSHVSAVLQLPAESSAPRLIWRGSLRGSAARDRPKLNGARRY